MGLTKTTRSFPYQPASLAPVAEQVMQAFRTQGYEVTGKETASGGQFFSITKGDTFKAVLGLKTALNVTIEPVPGGTQATCEVGTYGEQILGTAIAWLVFWPVAAVQIWGLIQNSKMDEQVLGEVEKALKAHSGGAAAEAPSGTPAGDAATTGDGATAPAAAPVATDAKTCSECGAALPEGAKFCTECGTRVAAPA